MVFEKSSNNFIFYHLLRNFIYASRGEHIFSFMVNYCNILVREACSWSVIPVEPTVNFSECFKEVKSGKFSNVVTSVELSSCILRSAFIG